VNQHDEPDLDLLLRWIEGKAAPQEAALVDGLLTDRNERMVRTINLLRWLLHDARRSTMERPPAQVHNALVALFDRVPDTLANALSLEGLAELLFDSRRDLVSPSTRGSTTAEPGFRLAFTSPHADVVLHVDGADNNRLTIHGQVMTREPRSDRFTVVTVDDVTSEPTPQPTTTDDYGRFSLTDVSATVRTLRIANKTLRLLVHLPPDADEQ
jgi:hypothetical protein